MITDKLTTFCNGTSLNTGAAGTYLIGSQIDMEDVRDLGTGMPIYLVITVETTATSGGSATGQFQLASDASASIATDGSATVHAQSDAIAVASLTAGTSVMAIALPMEGETYEQYLGILQITGTAAFTAGAVDAFLTTDVSKWKAYADANN